MSAGLTSQVRRAGRLARLSDVRCELGRHDKPFPEAHDAWTIALVRRGAFNYRTVDRRNGHSLREGWLLLGQPEQAYECSHDHDGGDECAVLTISEQLIEEHGGPFPSPVAAPIARVAALVEKTRASDDADLDEVAHLAVEAVLMRGQTAPQPDPQPQHRARVDEAIHVIETSHQDPLSLADLAARAGLSSYHFLRVFGRITGTTPRQYLIGARLRRAASLLLDTSRPVTTIAYDVGFQDLSNFVRTFHRVIGCSPRAYRRGASGRGAGRR
jgi:AraC-like DNA-binding protein